MPKRGVLSLPKPLLVFLATLILLAVTSMVDGLIGFRHGGVPGIGELWISHPGFDFYDYTPRFPYLHTGRFFSLPVVYVWVYPAPSIFPLYPFYLFSRPTHWHLGYAAFAAVSLTGYLVLAVGLGKALVARGLSARGTFALLGAVFFLGWPLYFALQRGNIEALLGIGIACGVWCFLKGRYLTAALLIGIVGSAKLYPLLFLALFLRPKRFGAIALALVSAVLTTLAALRFMEPDIADAWMHVRRGVASWTQDTALTYWLGGIGTDHSLFGALRQCTFGAFARPPHALEIYMIVAGVAATAVFFLRVWRLPVFQQTLFLATGAILLPPASYDYTLLQLFIPWAYFVVLCVERAREGNDMSPFLLPALLFGIAFAPLTFLHSYGAIPVRFEGPGRCIALLGLMIYAAVASVPETTHAEPRPTRTRAAKVLAG